MKERYLDPVELGKVRGWVEEARASMPPYRRQLLRLERSALLVLDMQRFFLEEGSHAFLPTGPIVLPQINALSSFYEARALPIVITCHAVPKGKDPGVMGRWWGDVLLEGDPWAELHPDLYVPASATVLRKDRYDAFHGTSLERSLRDRGVEQIVICGVMVHLCCESTARGGFMRDFEVFLVADAMATTNEAFHKGTLAAAAHGFAVPVLTEEVLRGGF